MRTDLHDQNRVSGPRGGLRLPWRLVVRVVLALPTLGAAAVPAVSFRKDVLPVFGHHCFKCHGDEKPKGDLNLRSRTAVFDRADPILVPGHSARSLLIDLVTNPNPEDRMPPKGRALSVEEVDVLRRWIDAGAPWDDADTRALTRRPDFRLAAPALPPGEGNPIDRFLAPYFARHQVDPAAQVDDRHFARRVWFDVVGLPPPPAQLQEFLADRDPRRRERLIDRLMSDTHGYAAHWMAFWQDHLRDGTRGIDEGGNSLCRAHYHVRPITPWLHRALVENKPYDQFARELINPPDLPRDPYADSDAFRKLPRDSSGFLQGIRIGGAPATAVQSPEIQAAQNIGQVFLGAPLKCATCHDSYIDGWKQKEVWALASVYAEKPLEIFKAETPTGRFAPAGFLFPELGRIDPAAPVRERVAQLAASLTSPENGLFARTVVNRVWARLFGRGLVETLDDLAEPAWYPELLDWLAADLIGHGYDLKHLIRQILTSRAWQRPGVAPAATAGAEPVFRGPLIRRLSSEQFLDTLYTLQGRPHRAWEQQPSPLSDVLGRPDRQIVATSRDTQATVLQWLELQNGSTLHQLLLQREAPPAPGECINEVCPVNGRRLDALAGGRKPEIVMYEGMPIGISNPAAVRSFKSDPKKYLPAIAEALRVTAIVRNRSALIAPGTDLVALAESRFLHALGRAPNDRERAVFRGVFGAAPTLADLADATWLILMKPEFQLLP